MHSAGESKLHGRDKSLPYDVSFVVGCAGNLKKSVKNASNFLIALVFIG